MVADVCHAPVTVFEQDEGASFGAALQALCILEGGSSDDLVNLASEHLSRDEPLCCEPDRLAVSEYQESYEAYQEAVSAVTPLYS